MRLLESGSLYTITQIAYMIFTYAPGYCRVSIFLTYVYTMTIAIAPMLLVLRLNDPRASEMHVIDFDATQRRAGGGNAPPALQSMGVVSTTIAFNPQPLTLSFWTE
ncbi:hypothetical protein FRB93_005778 [Tulasnella sp. JGI-2019a]|nr:hypothetical protein FRB93_005778 [Tulasnella sp. JGI-2019a]